MGAQDLVPAFHPPGSGRRPLGGGAGYQAGSDPKVRQPDSYSAWLCPTLWQEKVRKQALARGSGRTNPQPSPRPPAPVPNLAG